MLLPRPMLKREHKSSDGEMWSFQPVRENGSEARGGLEFVERRDNVVPEESDSAQLVRLQNVRQVRGHEDVRLALRMACNSRF